MQHAEQARRILAEQLSELRELVATSPAIGLEATHERLRRWKQRTVELLRRQVHPAEADRLAKTEKMSFRMGDPFGNLAREAQLFEGFLMALDEELKQHPDSVLSPTEPAPLGSDQAAKPGRAEGSTVFLVHGHDELNLLRLKELLGERWHLDPIVLSKEAGRGRTVIEKFEDEATRANFAFVLISPDDQVMGSDGQYAQARPNVIFELGWFYGRLGRGSVCLLFKKGTKIHSDLDGVSRIEFDSSVMEKVDEIERELVTSKTLKKAPSGV